VQPIHLLSDLDDVDARFIAAVAKVAGTNDVLLLDTWCGINPATGEMPEERHRQAAVYVERCRRPGRFGLDIAIFGRRRTEPNMSKAEFTRALACELGQPLVLSDCDANPWSYFRVDPDGAVHHVFTRVDDDQDRDRFDLACDLDPSDPEHIPATLIWPADEPLPRKPADAPDHLPSALRTFCLGATDAKLCETFWAPCPYLNRRR
jgi:hypothetical protein